MGSCMKFLGGNTQFGAEAEHPAIRETRGGIHHHHGGIYGLREAFDVRVVLGKNRFGVMCGVPVDMVNGLVERIDDAHANLQCQILGAPIRFVGGEQFGCP